MQIKKNHLISGLMVGIIILMAMLSPIQSTSTVTIDPLSGQAEVGTVEIHGVAAGVFDPALWNAGKLHILHDLRSPMLTPRQTGLFRNIYAPSIVETPQGWRVFFGAWDGVRTPNDRIYSLTTPDFLDFENRHCVIEHGPFIHVCNVNAHSDGQGGYYLVCTAYPDENGANKPIFFSSPDGKTWNGSEAPYPAAQTDLVKVAGYAPYKEADINGVNVMLKEGEQYHLYFSSFKDWGQIYRASGTDGKTFTFEKSVLDVPHMINDVQKIQVGNEAWYLMGLHPNGDHLFYSLSQDPLQFPGEKDLGVSQGDADRYIVAVGWVMRGNRVLGFLYGAGAVPSLDRNRIFARWLQKKVVFTAEDGTRYEPTGASGPDRQILQVPTKGELKGKFELFSEDGVTPLGPPQEATLGSGRVFQMTVTNDEAEFANLLDENLSRWEALEGGAPTGWSNKEGVLTFSGTGSSLRLKGEDYGDFILRLEYRLPVGGNSGVFIRQPHEFSAFEGIEIQVLDDPADVYKDLKPYQHAGSIYGVVPAGKDVIHPAGEWNSLEILCLGSRIQTQINGELLTNANVDDYRELRNRPKRGGLGLQNHGSTLEYRNIRMKRLD
jgi:hypothetical protein